MGGASSKALHASNDFELVIRSSKELEYLLETHFGAVAAAGAPPLGLQDKITIAGGAGVPPALQKRMRYLATIRNRLVHDRGFDAIPDRAAFIASFEASVAELNALVAAKQKAAGGAGAADKPPACAIM